MFKYFRRYFLLVLVFVEIVAISRYKLRGYPMSK
jgi:hypothetical protein